MLGDDCSRARHGGVLPERSSSWWNNIANPSPVDTIGERPRQIAAHGYSFAGGQRGRYGWREHRRPFESFDIKYDSNRPICGLCSHAHSPSPWGARLGVTRSCRSRDFRSDDIIGIGSAHSRAEAFCTCLLFALGVEIVDRLQDLSISNLGVAYPAGWTVHRIRTLPEILEIRVHYLSQQRGLNKPVFRQYARHQTNSSGHRQSRF